MKKLLTVRCLDENRDVIKTIAKMDKPHNLSAPVDELVLCNGSIVKEPAKPDMTKALLDDVERLGKENEILEKTCSDLRKLGQDERMNYWIERCQKAELEAKRLVNDGSS